MNKTFRFQNTKLFSPVIYGGDLPWEEDYFHLPASQITPEFLKAGDYLTDTDWWNKQYERCINGYTIANALVPGGDCYSEKKFEFVAEDGQIYYHGGNIEDHGDNGIYFKDLEIWVKDGNVTITGKHYFYLNFWKIFRLNDAKTRKERLNPKFTDLSYENWWIRELMRIKKKDNLWAKSRQKGFSEEEACDTGYEFLFFNDSQSAILGGEDFYNENTMKMVRLNIENLKNTQFYKELAIGGKRMDFLQSKFTSAEIHSRTCKDNEEAASGLTPSKAHLEEIGIWKKGLVPKVTAKLDASLEAEGVKTGYRVFTGTGGSMDEGVADMEKMAYNPAGFNLLEFVNRSEDSDENIKIARYVPGYRFKIIDEEGNSLCHESIKSILDKIKNAADEQKYTLTVDNALRLSDIFLIKTGGYFGKQIAQWCNERKAYINTHREAQVVKRYRHILEDPKNLFAGVEMEYDPEGPYMISEMPRRDSDGRVYDFLYRAGTDSYDQDEAAFSNSKGACWIKKGFLNANDTYNKFVAGVVERPGTESGGREEFYKHTAVLCVFFNAINLIEWSKILIFQYYHDHGLSSLLKLRPEFATANMVIETKATNKWGIDPSTKSHWLTMQKTYLENRYNIEKCDFIELLDAWAKFRYDPGGKKYNCDNTIASSLCTVCEEDEKEMEAQSQSKAEVWKPLRYIKDDSGNLIAVN